MLLNQQLDMPCLPGGGIISNKESERNILCVHKKKMEVVKNGSKNQSVAFCIIFALSVCRQNISARPKFECVCLCVRLAACPAECLLG